MKDNAINQLKTIAKVYAGINVTEYSSEITHWEDVINWMNLVMESTDRRLKTIQNQISEIWLIPGSTCELTEEF